MLTRGNIVAKCHSTADNKLKTAILDKLGDKTNMPEWNVQGIGQTPLHFCLLFQGVGIHWSLRIFPILLPLFWEKGRDQGTRIGFSPDSSAISCWTKVGRVGLGKYLITTYWPSVRSVLVKYRTDVFKYGPRRVQWVEVRYFTSSDRTSEVRK